MWNKCYPCTCHVSYWGQAACFGSGWSFCLLAGLFTEILVVARLLYIKKATVCPAREHKYSRIGLLCMFANWTKGGPWISNVICLFGCCVVGKLLEALETRTHSMHVHGATEKHWNLNKLIDWAYTTIEQDKGVDRSFHKSFVDGATKIIENPHQIRVWIADRRRGRRIRNFINKSRFFHFFVSGESAKMKISSPNLRKSEAFCPVVVATLRICGL